MDVDIRMVNMDTGEVFYNQRRSLVCQFTNNDVGRKLLKDVVDSAIRGVRIKSCPIELRIRLADPTKDNSWTLPFLGDVSVSDS